MIGAWRDDKRGHLPAYVLGASSFGERVGNPAHGPGVPATATTETGASSRAPANRPLELGLRHLGAPFDRAIPRFLVQLIARASARPFAVAPNPTAPARRDVLLRWSEPVAARPRKRPVKRILDVLVLTLFEPFSTPRVGMLDLPVLFDSLVDCPLREEPNVLARVSARLARGINREVNDGRSWDVHRWRIARSDHHHCAAHLDLLRSTQPGA